MGWLRRWDRRNADWADRVNQVWEEAPKVGGVPVERPNRLVDAYNRYSAGKLVLLGVLFAVALVVALIRAALG